MVEVSIIHLCAPSGCELTDRHDHAYIVCGTPTLHKKPVPQKGSKCWGVDGYMEEERGRDA